MSKNRYYANPVYHQDRLTFKIDPFEFVTTTGVVQYGGGTVSVTDNSSGYVIVDKTTGAAAYTTTAGTANKLYLVKVASSGGSAGVITYFDNAPFDADGSGGSSGIGEKPAVAVAYAASITPDIDSYGTFNVGTLTGTLTVNNPTGTPTDRQPATFRFVQNATGYAITWGANFAFGTDITSGDIPSTASAKFEVAFRYHSGDSKWRCIGLVRGF